MYMSCGGCNGCDIEVDACLTPRYDVERFGGLLKGSMRHADILIVTGIVNKQIKDRLIKAYNQMPEPKAVIAVGSCPIDGSVFYDSYNRAGPLDKLIPVDVYVPGCPPKPEAVLEAVLKAVEKIGGKK